MRFWTLLFRSCRLRCPRCGQGKLFRGLIAMHESCDHCGFPYARGDGYFLGAIYFNYGLTALVCAVTYPLLLLFTELHPNVILWSLLAFCVLFPLWFFRYSRSLWVGFDQLFDPIGRELETGPHVTPREPAGSSTSQPDQETPS